MIFKKLTFISTTLLGVVAICGAIALAAQVRPIQGAVILARGGSAASYIWDATPYVTQLTSDKMLGSSGMRALEATAVSALSLKAKTSRSATVALTIVYRRLSPMSIYGRPVFSGQEKLAIVTLPRADAAKHGAAWAQGLADGKVPAQVKIKIVGKLPAAK